MLYAHYLGIYNGSPMMKSDMFSYAFSVRCVAEELITNDYIFYEVKENDTIFDISRRFKVTSDDIMNVKRGLKNSTLNR